MNFPNSDETGFLGNGDPPLFFIVGSVLLTFLNSQSLDNQNVLNKKFFVFSTLLLMSKLQREKTCFVWEYFTSYDQGSRVNNKCKQEYKLHDSLNHHSQISFEKYSRIEKKQTGALCKYKFNYIL